MHNPGLIGFLKNIKIPLLNKTGINTIVGDGLLYVSDQHYENSELYAGINKEFKLSKTRF
jgi:hypothetical protein